MNNSTEISIFQLLQSKSDSEIISLCQQSVSLFITLCIGFKIFDLSGFVNSVKIKREAAAKKQRKKEYLKMKKIFEAVKNDEDIESINLSESEEKDEEKEDDYADAGVIKIARKKKKKKYTESEQQV
tara:strand:- start:730 stop:1110 length:381 start_codon:yes stop_codon:yes gene_type:complete